MTPCEEDDGDAHAHDDQEKVEEEWEEDDKDVWGHGVTLRVMCCMNAQQRCHVCSLYSLFITFRSSHRPSASSHMMLHQAFGSHSEVLMKVSIKLKKKKKKRKGRKRKDIKLPCLCLILDMRLISHLIKSTSASLECAGYLTLFKKGYWA